VPRQHPVYRSNPSINIHLYPSLALRVSTTSVEAMPTIITGYHPEEGESCLIMETRERKKSLLILSIDIHLYPSLALRVSTTSVEAMPTRK
jgi:hypothetical protein